MQKLNELQRPLQKLLYTTAEARSLISCGTTQLYALLGSGRIRARRLGSRTMIEAASLHEFINDLPRVVTPTMQRRASSDTETMPAV